jgi:hypothetical protein
LLKFTSTAQGTFEEIQILCKSCGEELSFLDIAEKCLQEQFSTQRYIAMTDGGDDPLGRCPECFREAYILGQEECALCQFSREDTACSMCGADLDLADYRFGGLCWYCYGKLTKDD